jgi:hypothetical protein
MPRGIAEVADSTVQGRAEAWATDPLQAFGRSNHGIHSIPRDEAEATQLAAVNIRLEQRRSQIPVLAKYADAQGIRGVETLEDVAPLCFKHDLYKSYPLSLLTKSRFDQLTKWLDRLTPFDLSQLDPRGCQSIDAWLELLRAETPLDVSTSSGTSGTLSFFPKSKNDFRTSVQCLRIQLTQEFAGGGPPANLDDPIHVVTPFFRDGYSTVTRLPAYFLEIFCRNDARLLHTALPFTSSADLMWLAGRLRAAQAKGDAGAVDVPEALLARRGEWERISAETASRQAEFIRAVVPELEGERVFALGITGLFYEIARAGLAEGLRAEFAPGSVVMGGGGGKGIVLPDDAEAVICEFFGVPRMRGGYGMTEQNFYLVTCEHERLHVPPWVIVLLLDPETGQPLPRDGVQSGRASFFDISNEGAWGGIVTGDRITVDYTPCPCGRTTLHLDKKIERFSDLAGGDDKLSCAATPSAQSAALDFLSSL